jgi:hypothetical protein
MCMSTPKMPAPTPPPQEVKQPDAMAARKKVRPAAGAGTMLTGPSGIANTSLNTGGSTLLGG